MTKLSPEALKATLGDYISDAKNKIDSNTIIGVQTILWIVDNTEKNLNDVLHTTTKYLTLEKNTEKSKGKIVFPSGTVDSHEIDKAGLSANGLMIAAMRELHEETLGLVTLAPSNYIDTYIYKIWNIDEHKKLLQFRLLAYIEQEQVPNIVQRFDEKYEKQKQGNPEHAACKIITCTSNGICNHVFDNNYNFMESTKASILEHNEHVRTGYYPDI